MVGVMMTRELAALVVERVNGYAALQEEVSRFDMERRLWNDHIEQAEAARDQAQADRDQARNDYAALQQHWPRRQIIGDTGALCHTGEQMRAERDQAQADMRAIVAERDAYQKGMIRATMHQASAERERDQTQAEAARLRAALNNLATRVDAYGMGPSRDWHDVGVALRAARQALGGGEGA
jgi:chromosome segregation ATPase